MLIRLNIQSCDWFIPHLTPLKMARSRHTKVLHFFYKNLSFCLFLNIRAEGSIIYLYCPMELFMTDKTNENASMIYQQLCEAAQRGEVNKIQKLLTNSALDVNKPSPLTGVNPLMGAAINGRLDAVNLLLQHPRIDVNCKSPQGTTPLIVAAIKNHYQIVESLLNANINDKLVNDAMIMLPQMKVEQPIIQLLQAHQTALGTHQKLLEAAQKGQDELIESSIQKPEVLHKQLLIAYHKKQPVLTKALLNSLDNKQKQSLVLYAAENNYPQPLLEELKGSPGKVSDFSVFSEKQAREPKSNEPIKGIDLDSI